MVYTATGPFVSGSAPGIDAPLLNNVENFLVGMNNAVSDSHISSDGAGNLTITGATANKFQLSGTGAIVQLLTGSVSRISFFNGTGNATVSHGLGATPTFCMIFYAGSSSPFGSPPTHPLYYYNMTSTQVTVVADSGYSWLGMAIHT